MVKRSLFTLGHLKKIISEKYNVPVDSVVVKDYEKIYYCTSFERDEYEEFNDNTFLLQFDTEEI
jgi:hypothetical protein